MFIHSGSGCQVDRPTRTIDQLKGACYSLRGPILLLNGLGLDLMTAQLITPYMEGVSVLLTTTSQTLPGPHHLYIGLIESERASVPQGIAIIGKRPGLVVPGPAPSSHPSIHPSREKDAVWHTRFPPPPLPPSLPPSIPLFLREWP